MKKLLVLISFCSLTLAEIQTHGGTVASGTVPFAASWELTDADNTAALPAAAVADYDNGYIQILDFIQITDFDCNSDFTIQMYRGAWTVPADYSDDGNKHAGGSPVDSDSDFLVNVDNITAGYTLATSEGLVTSYGSGYTAIGNQSSPSTIMSGGTATSDGGHGVENAIADINIQILMDWAKDVEGAYSINTVLTIVDSD